MGKKNVWKLPNRVARLPTSAIPTLYNPSYCGRSTDTIYIPLFSKDFLFETLSRNVYKSIFILYNIKN